MLLALFKNLLLIFGCLYAITASASDVAKIKRPSYGKYSLFASNVCAKNFLSLANQQTYQISFVSPNLRKQSIEYYNQSVSKRIATQEKRLASKAEKLARELEEDKYQIITPAPWDRHQGIEVLVIPMLRVYRPKYGPYTYYSNKQAIETAIVVDKDLNLVCETQSSRPIGKDHSYISKLYPKLAYLDHTMEAKLFTFDPNCLLKDSATKILVKNYSARAASAKINKKIKKVISNDLGLAS